MSLSQDITDMITPIAQQNDFRIWDVKITKAAKRSLVSITLDKSGGATLDEIAEMSKKFAPKLDDHPRLGDSYHLEVSTPGLERALLTPDHFRFSLGLDITVSYRGDTLIRTRGKLVAVSDEDITIETEDAQQLNIAFVAITKAHTLFDFEGAMKNGPIDENQPEGEIA